MKRVIVMLAMMFVMAGVYSDSQIADAIYRAEGGANTKYPYGIRSIDTHGDTAYARQICLNTIRNNRARWDGRGDYVDFLAGRYCPIDKHNWARMVKCILKTQSH